MSGSGGPGQSTGSVELEVGATAASQKISAMPSAGTLNTSTDLLVIARAGTNMSTTPGSILATGTIVSPNGVLIQSGSASGVTLQASAGTYSSGGVFVSGGPVVQPSASAYCYPGVVTITTGGLTLHSGTSFASPEIVLSPVQYQGAGAYPSNVFIGNGYAGGGTVNHGLDLNFAAGPGNGGGLVKINGGHGYTTSGGSIILTAGGAHTAGVGGDVSLLAGGSDGSNPGNVRLVPGAGTSGSTGNILVNNRAGLTAIAFSWKAGEAINGATIFTATRNWKVISITGRLDTAAGSALTLAPYVAGSGTAFSSGTPATTNSFDANGSAAANQTLTWNIVTVLEGQSLGIVASSGLTASAGSLTITLAPT